ncbi:hypothetical protein E2320_010110 [Naja naja]|nr:hypothetical protein E2320_010110 [Naja naja]
MATDLKRRGGQFIQGTGSWPSEKEPENKMPPEEIPRSSGNTQNKDPRQRSRKPPGRFPGRGEELVILKIQQPPSSSSASSFHIQPSQHGLKIQVWEPTDPVLQDKNNLTHI